MNLKNVTSGEACCSKRFGYTTMLDCWARCLRIIGCHGFSFSLKGGFGQNHDRTVCTLYSWKMIMDDTRPTDFFAPNSILCKANYLWWTGFAMYLFSWNTKYRRSLVFASLLRDFCLNEIFSHRKHHTRTVARHQLKIVNDAFWENWRVVDWICWNVCRFKMSSARKRLHDYHLKFKSRIILYCIISIDEAVFLASLHMITYMYIILQHTTVSFVVMQK